MLGATLMVSLAYHLIGYPAGPTNLPILVAVYTAAAAGRLTLALLAGGAFTGVGVAYRSLVEGDPLGVEDGLADSIPAELLQAAPVAVVRVAVHQMDCVVLAGLDS